MLSECPRFQWTEIMTIPIQFFISSIAGRTMLLTGDGFSTLKALLFRIREVMAFQPWYSKMTFRFIVSSFHRFIVLSWWKLAGQEYNFLNFSVGIMGINHQNERFYPKIKVNTYYYSVVGHRAFTVGAVSSLVCFALCSNHSFFERQRVAVVNYLFCINTASYSNAAR